MVDSPRTGQYVFLSPQKLGEIERALAPIRQALGEERVKTLQAEGQAMTLEQAIDYAWKYDAIDTQTTT